ALIPLMEVPVTTTSWRLAVLPVPVADKPAPGSPVAAFCANESLGATATIAANTATAPSTLDVRVGPVLRNVMPADSRSTFMLTPRAVLRLLLAGLRERPRMYRAISLETVGYGPRPASIRRLGTTARRSG